MGKNGRTPSAAAIVGIKILFITAAVVALFFGGNYAQSRKIRARVEKLFGCTIDEEYKDIYYYSDGFTDLDYLWVFEGEGIPVKFLQSVGRLYSSMENPEETENFSKSFYLHFGKEEYHADLTQEFFWREADVFAGGAVLYAPHECRIYFYAYTM